MKSIKNVNEEIALKLNEGLDVQYSEKRYNVLLKGDFIEVFEMESNNDLVEIYSKSLDKRSISRNISNNIDKKVSEFIIELGKKECSNIHEFDGLIVKINSDYVFSDKSIILNTVCYPENLAEYYIYKYVEHIGNDCISYSRCCRCFMLNNIENSISEELDIISAILNLKEGQLNVRSENSPELGEYYVISLNGKTLGVWSQDLLDNFYEESEDVRIGENHDEDTCSNCMADEYCKFKDEKVILSRELLSDKLNMPIFSIQLLLDTLNRDVIIED